MSLPEGFECDEYGHIAVDCPDRYHHQACLHAIRDNTLAQGITPDQLLDTTSGIGTGIAGQDHSHTLTDLEVTVIKTCTEVIPDHIIDTIMGALHNTITPALIFITVTHHTEDYPNIEVP